MLWQGMGCVPSRCSYCLVCLSELVVDGNGALVSSRIRSWVSDSVESCRSGSGVELVLGIVCFPFFFVWFLLARLKRQITKNTATREWAAVGRIRFVRLVQTAMRAALCCLLGSEASPSAGLD